MQLPMLSRAQLRLQSQPADCYANADADMHADPRTVLGADALKRILTSARVPPAI